MTTTATILVADDDRGIRTVLAQALGRAGYEVRTTGNASTLWRWVSEGDGDLVITDVVMPDESGLDLLPRIKKIRPELRIIVMSAQNTLLTAVKATQRGAFEYLPKPFDLKELVNVVGRALSTPRATPAEASAADDEEKLPLIGRSPAMQEIYRTLARLMSTDLSVMITGESGTGKELVARALHDYGKRRNGPFVAINMAAIPRELIESELFGHEKGAFTGAISARQGRFEMAEGGTLFLDEIGDMSLHMQVKLLRVLQERTFERVGSNKSITANVRIIAATHRNLEEAIKQGRFREDLYYRLNVFPIEMPPLRERAEDVPLLTNELIARLEHENRGSLRLTPAAIMCLTQYPWPGNVRELANLVERMVILFPNGTVDVDDLPEKFRPAGLIPYRVASQAETESAPFPNLPLTQLPEEGLDLKEHLNNLEYTLIKQALDDANGVVAQAAKRLKLGRTTLVEKLRKYEVTDREGATGF
ncbi:MAG: nitrogen regulation protein NR(I) [Magnetospirillum sp.]|nr:nitrogen regulation protein NR(I) [Magnetospirillum sp.]